MINDKNIPFSYISDQGRNNRYRLEFLSLIKFIFLLCLLHKKQYFIRSYLIIQQISDDFQTSALKYRVKFSTTQRRKVFKHFFQSLVVFNFYVKSILSRSTCKRGNGGTKIRTTQEYI